MCSGQFGGSNDFIHRDGRIGESDVFAYGFVEQIVFLQNNADLAAQPGGIYRGDVNTVNQNLSAFGNVKALNQFGYGRLARAAGADKPDFLSGGNFEAHFFQDFGTVGQITESDVFELDVTVDGRHGTFGKVGGIFGGIVQDIGELVHRYFGLLEVLP